MATLAFFGKYREGGLLLFRVSIGLILIILIGQEFTLATEEEIQVEMIIFSL